MTWIPVKERLPEEFKPVLVYREGYKRGLVRNFEVAAWMNPCPNHPRGNFSDGIRYTHWMPLPEPPRESE